jgi:hypothetical protein
MEHTSSLKIVKERQGIEWRSSTSQYRYMVVNLLSARGRNPFPPCAGEFVQDSFHLVLLASRSHKDNTKDGDDQLRGVPSLRREIM